MAISTTPRTFGAALVVAQIVDLATLPSDGLTLGTQVYVSATGTSFVLALSSASVNHTTVEAVQGISGARWLLVTSGSSTVNTSAPVSGDGSGGTPITIADGAIANAKLTTAPLVTAGKAGGQSIVGGTAASEALTLQSTANATRGKINLGGAGTSFFDEVAGSVKVSGDGTTEQVNYRVTPTSDSGIGAGMGVFGNALAFFCNGARGFIYQGAANVLTFACNLAGLVAVDPGGNTVFRTDSTNMGARFSRRAQRAKGTNAASASPLVLANDGNTFHVTGTTNFAGILTTDWQAGAEINLIFDGVLTITHNSGAPGTNAVKVFFKSGANLTTAANVTLRLVYDGSIWYEI